MHGRGEFEMWVNEDGLSMECLPNVKATHLTGCDIRGTVLVCRTEMLESVEAEL